MENNKRPEDMERITTPELANAFIDEQVRRDPRAGRRRARCCWRSPAAWTRSVVAALLIKAIGRQLVCVHVNHGLMRKGESEQVIEVFQQPAGRQPRSTSTPPTASSTSSPAWPSRRAKRKIIGAEFIRVFEEEARKAARASTSSRRAPSIPTSWRSQDGVKAHHNVGGLPEDLQFELVEPAEAALQGRGARRRRGAGPARRHGLSPAVPRPRPGRALPGRDHPRPPGRAARGRRHPARGVRQERPDRQGVAVLRRGAGYALHRRARRQARLRLAGDPAARSTRWMR